MCKAPSVCGRVAVCIDHKVSRKAQASHLVLGSRHEDVVGLEAAGGCAACKPLVEPCLRPQVALGQLGGLGGGVDANHTARLAHLRRADRDQQQDSGVRTGPPACTSCRVSLSDMPRSTSLFTWFPELSAPGWQHRLTAAPSRTQHPAPCTTGNVGCAFVLGCVHSWETGNSSKSTIAPPGYG